MMKQFAHMIHSSGEDIQIPPQSYNDIPLFFMWKRMPSNLLRVGTELFLLLTNELKVENLASAFRSPFMVAFSTHGCCFGLSMVPSFNNSSISLSDRGADISRPLKQKRIRMDWCMTTTKQWQCPIFLICIK